MPLVTYELADGVATITMDDGKVNVLSNAMQEEINAALDQAEAAGAVVVLAGREGRFSGGFDLGTIRSAGPDALKMLRGGFELSARLLSFPRPVVIACTGHAIAMASFLLLSGDYRIGAAGDFKIQANEVAIGMTLPWAAIEICRYRLTNAGFNRATILAEVFSPDGAVEVGYLDKVVPVAELAAVAHETAVHFTTLDATAHTGTKLRVRDAALTALRAATAAEFPA